MANPLNRRSAASSPRSTFRVRAHAKINLSLRVLGARPDGYHELRTIFQSIALHDTLTIRIARGPFRLTCDDPNCPADYTNLIWRAAEAMWQAARRRGAPRDVAIELRKRIPMNAGLGGGSSDAAAAVRVFARLWGVDEARAHAIGRELGADVPYFFAGGTVLGLERGDLLFPLVDRPPAWVVLVLPAFGVSTKDAFSWWDQLADVGPAFQAGRRGRPESAPLRDAGESKDLINDLERVVSDRHPQIARIVTRLRRAGASQAAMTGSGSTVFGLLGSEAAAGRAARALASRSRLTHVTRTVNRAQYQRLAAI
jgi:4-diphosphocytidyl-2-C-methyl-D-erythritol kinase